MDDPPGAFARRQIEREPGYVTCSARSVIEARSFPDRTDHIANMHTLRSRTTVQVHTVKNTPDPAPSPHPLIRMPLQGMGSGCLPFGLPLLRRTEERAGVRRFMRRSLKTISLCRAPFLPAFVLSLLSFLFVSLN